MWIFVYNLNFQRRKAMFFKMLKNDLRQKKALNFVLFLFTLRNGASLELQSAKLCGDNRKFVIPDNANNTRFDQSKRNTTSNQMMILHKNRPAKRQGGHLF